MRQKGPEMRETLIEIGGFMAVPLLQFAPLSSGAVSILRPPTSDLAFPMDFEQARFNMIEQQIRTWEVLDPQVLDLLFEVKREDFVPPEHREIAFADLEVPLGHGESMMQPKVEARIVQELALQPHENVYEVGTGSGYLTSLLARRARHVTSAEIHGSLRSRAAENLRNAGRGNVTLLQGDSAA